MSTIQTQFTLSPLEEALRLASYGVKVIPLHTPLKDGCSCGRNHCKSAGKHPIWSDWTNKATDDVDEIRRIWQKYSMANLGVPMGQINDIFALDIDGPEGMETLQSWLETYGEIPATWQIATGGGGIQLWYRMSNNMDVPNSVKKIGLNIDIRGTGGQSVGPGSMHHSGKRYQWLPGRSPGEMELADAPDWLIKKIQEVIEAQKKADLSGLDLGSISISFHLDKNMDQLMEKAASLTKKSQAFKEVTTQQRAFASASERDLSIANIAAVHGWSDQDMVDFLVQYRKFHGEDLKHPLYYKLTIAKARQWANEKRQENGEQEYIETEVEPIPLPQKLAVEPFPEDVFPEPISRFLKAVSVSIGLPTDYPGVHVLTFLGTAIGNSRMIELKPGYRQQPNLYTCMIADTGSGKSPAQDQAFAPLLAFQNDYYQIYQRKMEEYESAYRSYQVEMNGWKKQKSKDEDLPEEPELPRMKELYITQATMEALLRALKNNDRGLVLKADELSGWIRGMNQYKGGKGDDREQYLSLWSGSDIKINRVRDNEPLFIPKPFFAVTGNIPPDIVPALEDEQGSEDGFIHRILFSYPDNQNPSKWTWTGISDEQVQGYSDVLERLYKLKRMEDKPIILPLTSEAKKWWEEWYDIHIREMTDPDFPRKLRGPWAKMPNQMARISLIIHMIRVVCGEATEDGVDEISITRAAEVVKYFKSHARKVYLHLKKSSEDKRITEAIEWIQKRGGVVRKRDIQMYKVADCKKTSEVEALFKTLQDFGYGKIQKVQPSRGRPTIEFVLFDQKRNCVEKC